MAEEKKERGSRGDAGDEPRTGGKGRVHLAEDGERKKVDWKRLLFMFLGLGLFCVVNFSPPWPDAVDPNGQHFVLSTQGKAALALFLLAATWWVFEVVPIGITGITIAVVQALFLIRPDRMVVAEEGGTAERLSGTWTAFSDFLAPSVWFIVGSLVIGMTFSKVGLTKRMAYKMLSLVGERTSRIYLGCFVMTAALTHIMAHTAVAAALFPLLVTIYSFYDDTGKPSKFGKGLFMGMAYVAGAGSIITLLGAARGAVAIGFFQQIVTATHPGREITFFGLTYYMAPVGWLMVFLIWGFMMVAMRPEKKVIPGLKERSKQLYARLGRMSRTEGLVLLITVGAILFMSLQRFFPPIAGIDKSGIILVTTILFFALKILEIKDLEELPWNIVLLFGGAMSIGYCLWQSGAAQWLAINWLMMFQGANWLVFVLAITFFVLVMTNFIMNVAAIAISLPVALVIAPYIGVEPEVITFASLVAAGMPFMLLVGAAPNAIAYEGKQFTSGEFFLWGSVMSVILMGVVTLFVVAIWPAMGMPVLSAATGN